MSDPLDLLVSCSRSLGDPALGLAILGEGNTSIRHDAETFWVKASGSTLDGIGRDGFVRLRFDRILALLDGPALDAEALSAAYEAAKAEANPRRPSVETIFHAALLSLPGVQIVAHTHPTAVNGLNCARGWPQVLEGRLFPDEAVVLGRHSCFVPYIDPGLELGRAIRDACAAFVKAHGAAPKSIYMQNHGFIALGKSPADALAISRMAVKAAEIRLGALAAGGIRRLDDAVADHLVARPDEKYREALLAR